MLSIIAFTQRGCALGRELAAALQGELYTPERFAREFSALSYQELGTWTGEQFRLGNDLLFVSATGIAVRSIAPFVRDKLQDPAVVALDELGRFAVPLLSGHVGGANALARRVAAYTGGQAVISTATDLNGCFAVDLWAKENGLLPLERELICRVSATLLSGEEVGISSALPLMGELPPGLTQEKKEIGIQIAYSHHQQPFHHTLHLLPRGLVLGIGCRRGTPAGELATAIDALLQREGINPLCICEVGSIDLKQDEAGLLALCQQRDWPLRFFSARELEQAEGDFPHSPFVQRTTGVGNVCQRAVVCMGARVLVPKQSMQGITLSLGERPLTLQF